MASGNGSFSSLTGHDCCCSITREDFEVRVVPTGVYVLNTTILVLTSIFATVANLLVLVSIWRCPALHSPSNVLLFSLALSDLGVGLSVVPPTLVVTTAKFIGSELFLCASLATSSLAGGLLIFASLLTVTAISLDTYLALYLHLRYCEIVTTKKMIGVLAGIWVCAVIVALLNAWYRKYLTLLWVFLIVLFLLVTTTTYLRVFSIVRHHQTQIHAQTTIQQHSDQENDENRASIAQQKKSLVTKFLIYCSLVACFLPFSVLKAVKSRMAYSDTIESMYQMCFAMVCFNSIVNPFIYCWRFEKIRTAVIETTKMMFRRQTAVQR